MSEDDLVLEMWANNNGRVSDAGLAVREARNADLAAEASSQIRITQRLQQPWDEQTETARLLAALGLA